jgi:hypothetical protein
VTAKYDQETLNWTKFSEYVIADGWIRPAPTATPISYDPWASYRVASAGRKQPHSRKTRKGEAQYLSLVRLGDSLADATRRLQQGDPTITEGEAKAILAFVKANGLLGISQYDAKKIGTPGWLKIDALFQLWTKSTTRRADSWTLLPMHSPEFFATYCEHVQDFLEATYVFTKAVELTRDGVYDYLDDLRAGVFTRTKAIRDSKGRIVGATDEVVYRSLLDAFAEQVARDLKGGFRLMTCPGCGQTMRTNDGRTIYCSEQCRWKVIRREQRRKAAGDRPLRKYEKKEA